MNYTKNDLKWWGAFTKPFRNKPFRQKSKKTIFGRKYISYPSLPGTKRARL